VDAAGSWRARVTYDGPGSRVVLDENDLARGSDYFDIGLLKVSPDERVLAYSVDTTGDEVYGLRFRDLTTGLDLPDLIERSYFTGAWSSDSSPFFYTVHNEKSRPYLVWRHRLGTPAADDRLVFSEPDERFDVEVRLCRSGALIELVSFSRDTTEVWLIDAGR